MDANIQIIQPKQKKWWQKWQFWVPVTFIIIIAIVLGSLAGAGVFSNNSNNNSPIKGPTRSPAMSPVASPTRSPIVSPVMSPTKSPIASPTKSPVMSPVASPTKSPTKSPVMSPVASPTKSPTKSPVMSPVASPTKSPVMSPTVIPTQSPTASPVPDPTLPPTLETFSQSFSDPGFINTSGNGYTLTLNLDEINIPSEKIIDSIILTGVGTVRDDIIIAIYVNDNNPSTGIPVGYVHFSGDNSGSPGSGSATCTNINNFMLNSTENKLILQRFVYYNGTNPYVDFTNITVDVETTTQLLPHTTLPPSRCIINGLDLCEKLIALRTNRKYMSEGFNQIRYVDLDEPDIGSVWYIQPQDNGNYRIINKESNFRLYYEDPFEFHCENDSNWPGDNEAIDEFKFILYNNKIVLQALPNPSCFTSICDSFKITPRYLSGVEPTEDINKATQFDIDVIQ